MKSKFSEWIKVLGFVYFLLNAMFFTVLCIAGIYAVMRSSECSPGGMSLVFPTGGMLSGYWIRHGRYSWWRIVIIAMSLFSTAALIFTAIFIAPKL